jgi:hypothetical protein
VDGRGSAIVARSLLGDRRSAAAADPIWDVLAALDGRRAGDAIASTFRGPRRTAPESWPRRKAVDRSQDPLASASGTKARARAAPIPSDTDPVLRWRLLKAMALEARSREDRDALLASRLLYRRGRLTTTATPVDLHQGIEQADNAVRLAKHDANPG